MEECIPNCQEILYYNSIYASLLEDDQDTIPLVKAANLIKRSGLDKQENREIWKSVIPEDAETVDQSHFRKLLRLVALVEEGYSPSVRSLKENARNNIRFAEIDGIPAYRPVNRFIRRFSSKSFHQLTNGDTLDGKVAVPYIVRSGVSKSVLKQVWAFVDYEKTMVISIEQWEVYLLLIAAVQSGKPYSDSLYMTVMDDQSEQLSIEEETPKSETNFIDFGESSIQSPPSEMTGAGVTLPPQSVYSMQDPSSMIGNSGFYQQSQAVQYGPQFIQYPVSPFSPQLQPSPVTPPLQTQPSAEVTIQTQPREEEPIKEELPSNLTPQRLSNPSPFMMPSARPQESVPQQPEFPKTLQPSPLSANSQPPVVTAAEWREKGGKVWDVLAKSLWKDVTDGPETTTKQTAKCLREWGIDKDSIKRCFQPILDKEMDSINEASFKTILVNLGNEDTKKPLFLCNIPIIPERKELCEKASATLERIREEIQKASKQPPLLGVKGKPEGPLKRRDFYENVKHLYEDLIRRGDLREIEKLPHYLEVLYTIRELMRHQGEKEKIQALQDSIPTPNDIIKRYTQRPPIKNRILLIKERLSRCEEYTQYTLSLIPENPVLFVEMNDIGAFVRLAEKLDYLSSVVEIVSLPENQSFVQNWMKMMRACEAKMKEVQTFMEYITEDSAAVVMQNEKCIEFMKNVVILMRITYRMNDCLEIVDMRMESEFDHIKSIYMDAVNKYNLYNEEKLPVSDPLYDYQRQVADETSWPLQNVCQFCLHKEMGETGLSNYMGRLYHPECANMWITCIDKSLPILSKKGDNLL